MNGILKIFLKVDPWPAKGPYSQSETELQKARLDLGAEHHSQAGSRFLLRKENRTPWRKTLGVRLRSTETQLRYDVGTES